MILLEFWELDIIGDNTLSLNCDFEMFYKENELIYDGYFDIANKYEFSKITRLKQRLLITLDKDDLSW